MLVLKRKFGQSVTIADGITVTVLGSGSNGIALGIDAPRSVPVVRSELLKDSPPDDQNRLIPDSINQLGFCKFEIGLGKRGENVLK